MAKQPRNYPVQKDVTNPFWWCAAIICTIITVGVIIVGIIIFVGYLIIHPRVPNISVVDARLNQFQYDYTGVLITQVIIVLRSQNDNSKAHASFSGLKLNLMFDGTVIALLQAGEYNVSKHNHVDFNFVATSSPISLDPQQMQTVDTSLNEDRVRFDLKGDAKARWRVGLLGSVRFVILLQCRLEFRRSDGSYIPSPCTSKAK